MEIKTSHAAFAVGQLITHRLFHYRGVIIDVDASFQETDAWYEKMAKSHPPKDKPWYHVLVHGTHYSTYVAERNLEQDTSQEAIKHPELDKYFERFAHGIYLLKKHMRCSVSMPSTPTLSLRGSTFGMSNKTGKINK